MSIRSYIVWFALTGLLFSCRKDIPPQRPSATGSISTGKRLVICNEGNFGSGNGSITLYDPISGGIVSDAYGPANSGQYIGDVLQSCVRSGNRYYWVVNNSGKIVVTDKDFLKQADISGFVSPRFIEIVSNNKAYVSNLQLSASQPNYLHVLDLNTNTISKTIRLDGWTEEMEQSYGKVYVCNQRKKHVYVIDAATDIVIDSIYMNATSACIVKDQNEKLWVSCNADASGNIPARLVRINPLADSVEADISLQTTANSVSKLAMNGNGNVLYYLMGDVFKMPISAGSGTLLVSQGSRVFYGLCLDPADETVYITDAIDFNQNGNIWIYKPDGTYLSTFKSGIIPGFMWVEN